MATSNQQRDELIERLLAFEHGELDAAEADEVRRLIERDEDVRVLLHQLQGTKSAVRGYFRSVLEQKPDQDLLDLIDAAEAPPAPDVPDDVESGSAPSASVHRLAHASSQGPSGAEAPTADPVVATPEPRARFGGHPDWWLMAASLAGLVIAGVIGYQIGVRNVEQPPPIVATASPSWTEQVAHYHRVYASDAEHLVEIAADEETHIEAWLSERLGRPFRVPHLKGHGLTFAGARQLVFNGMPVAQLMYLGPDGPVAFCVTPMPMMMGQSSPPTPSQDDDLNLVDWAQAGFGYIVVGWAPLDLLKQLAQEIKLIYSV